MAVVFCKLCDFVKYLLRPFLRDVVRAEGSVREGGRVRGREGERKGGRVREEGRVRGREGRELRER